MKNKSIILDIDEVLTPMFTYQIKLYNEEYGENITLDDIINYDYRKCPAIKYDILKYFNDPEFFTNLKPYKDAVAGVKILQEIGYDLSVATATKRPNYNARHDWTIKYFPTIPEENIIFCSRKDLLVADWFFDDCLDHIFKNKSKNVVCRTRPWNDIINHPEAKDVTRVKNFKEFVDLVLTTDKKSIASA